MSDLTDSELVELERELDALDDEHTRTVRKLDRAFAELRRHRGAGRLRTPCGKEPEVTDNATPVVMVSNARQRIAEALQDLIEEFEAACKERDRARRDRDYYRAGLWASTVRGSSPPHTCSTCRFLGTEAPIERHLDDDPYVEHSAHRRCLRVVHANANSTLGQDVAGKFAELAVVQDGSGYAATLCVLPSFWCALHEPTTKIESDDDSEKRSP